MAKPRRTTKAHMRCTRERCKKRFKGVPGANDLCPACGSRAKPDVWAAKKEWRRLTCDCNGLVYIPNDKCARHRRGSLGCIHAGGDLPMAELPGDGKEYPF